MNHLAPFAHTSQLLFPGRGLITITPFSHCSLGGGTGILSSLTAGAWSTASRAVFVPFRIVDPILVVKLFMLVGDVSSGNVDVGIYDRVGTRILSTGSVAQGTADTMQEFDVTDTILPPGQYYIATAIDNTTARTLRSTNAIPGSWALLGCAQMAAAFPLPATATFATIAATAHIPGVGLTARSLV